MELCVLVNGLVFVKKYEHEKLLESTLQNDNADSQQTEMGGMNHFFSVRDRISNILL